MANQGLTPVAHICTKNGKRELDCGLQQEAKLIENEVN